MASDETDRRADLIAELSTLRRAGITRLRDIELPAVREVARKVTGREEPAAVEHLLRQAIFGLGGGDFSEAASTLFGLSQGTRGRNPQELRRSAARLLGVQPDTFRKNHERRVIAQMAEQLVGLAVLQKVNPPEEAPEERRARLERIANEIAGLPASDLGPLVQILTDRLNLPK